MPRMPRGAKELNLKPAWWIAFGVLCGLGAAGLVLLLVAPRRGQPIQLIAVPTRPASTASAAVTPSPTPQPTSAFPIDINSATEADFENLPGIGPSLAQSIVAYRESNGPFLSLEDLQNVPNIGPRTYEAILPFITLGDQP